MRLHQTFTIALLSSVLFACGSGGDGAIDTGSSTGLTTSTESDSSSSSTDTDSDTDTDTDGYALLSFEGADPTTISISGSTGEGTSETSTVTFKLLDVNGEALAGEEVSFSLTDSPADTSLLISSATTDDNGEVYTVVKSGPVEGPVTVKMIPVSYPELYKLSNSLSVTNGYPDQDSFSLSTEELAPEGYNYDGTQVAITIRLGGGDGNTAVPDGTVVNFRTTGGKISDDTGTVSTCSTIGSVCSMVWESQDPRPTSGRALITAYSVGEESFTDSNRDGLYTVDEDFIDNPEAFADVDHSGAQNDDEWFDDANGDQSYTEGNGLYDGLHCPVDSDFCNRESVTIFDSIELVMSGSDLYCTYYSDEELTNEISVVSYDGIDTATFYVVVTDQNGNTPPNETSITGSGTNVTLSSSSWSVLDSNNYYYSFPVSVKQDGDVDSSVVSFSLSTPLGYQSTCEVEFE